jgi:hypothetical protein
VKKTLKKKKEKQWQESKQERMQLLERQRVLVALLQLKSLQTLSQS